MSLAVGSIATVLEAARRRRSIAAEASRATLAGLHGVHVEVEPINADAEQHGLARADVEADVGALLGEGGLTVHTPTRVFAEEPGAPILHVDVMTVRLDGRYSYSVRLELWQRVRLARAPGVTALALTWSAPQVVGTVAAESLAQVRTAVRAAVETFVADCRAAAPGGEAR